jgi:hypothetical protein
LSDSEDSASSSSSEEAIEEELKIRMIETVILPKEEEEEPFPSLPTRVELDTYQFTRPAGMRLVPDTPFFFFFFGGFCMTTDKDVPTLSSCSPHPRG